MAPRVAIAKRKRDEKVEKTSSIPSNQSLTIDVLIFFFAMSSRSSSLVELNLEILRIFWRTP
jgi:hypothetical protein